jgi:hypothetical protein
MAIYELDVSHASDDTEWTQINELDGVRYLLRFTWNRRDEALRLSLYLPDGTELALSRKLVCNVPLFRGEIDERLPPGLLMVVDLLGKDDSDPDLAGFGDRWILAYYDAEFVATGQ